MRKADTYNKVSFSENHAASEDFKGVGFRRNGFPDIIDDMGQRNATLILV